MPAMPSNAETISRRSFLELAWKSLLALIALAGLNGVLRFLGYQENSPRQTEFDLGSAESYPPGSSTLVAESQAVLLNTGKGFTALSLTCPHLGCRVKLDEAGFACPCHGSRFDAGGGVLRGPADQPLRLLVVETRPDDTLVLYLSNNN